MPTKHPSRPDPLCRMAAALSCAFFAVLLIDTLAPAAVTAPHLAGAPISTLPD